MSKLKLLAPIALVTLALGTGLAYASVNTDSTNSLTGPFSDNQSIIDTSKLFDFQLNNLASIDRSASADINTGGNDTSTNTTLAGVRTGDVNVDFTHRNDLAGNLIVPTMTGLGNVATLDRNLLTGPNSINENIVNADQSINLDITNNSRVTDSVALDLNTGNNEVSTNTTVGNVTTGDITGAVRFDNVGSRMVSFLNLGNAGNSDVTASLGNGTTGPNSVNENDLSANSTVNVAIENQTDVVNAFAATAQTGNNEVSTNTTVGNVRTGNVRINLDSTNTAF